MVLIRLNHNDHCNAGCPLKTRQGVESQQLPLVGHPWRGPSVGSGHLAASRPHLHLGEALFSEGFHGESWFVGWLRSGWLRLVGYMELYQLIMSDSTFCLLK